MYSSAIDAAQREHLVRSPLTEESLSRSPNARHAEKPGDRLDPESRGSPPPHDDPPTTAPVLPPAPTGGPPRPPPTPAAYTAAGYMYRVDSH